jgi:hypothetical protein
MGMLTENTLKVPVILPTYWTSRGRSSIGA